MNLIEHNLLTLDFWQDHVTYEGKSMPTGTLACAALNLPDEVIAKLSRLCMPLNLYMGALQLGQADTRQMEPARDAAFQIVELLRDAPPFSILDYGYVKSKVDAVFTEDYLQNAADFAKSGSLAGAVSPEYQKAMTLLRVLPVMAHMGYSLGEFKRELIPFAEKLHGSDRTADSYAASFGQFFSGAPDLSSKNPGWMSLANTSIQYVTAKIPGRSEPQLVKRMHYVLLCRDVPLRFIRGAVRRPRAAQMPHLRELVLTHRCEAHEILQRPCTRGQIRAHLSSDRQYQGTVTEGACPDHPWKRIYERRMNTIIQKLRRGTLDEKTASMMKRLQRTRWNAPSPTGHTQTARMNRKWRRRRFLRKRKSI